MTTESPSFTTDSTSSTKDVAKDQASAVGQSATDAGQQVASVAKDQAQNVAAEASSQAKDLLHQTRSELTEQAGSQQQRLAGGLHSLADELHSMGSNSENPGMAADLAKQAATRSHDAASWLEAREPGQLVHELQSFARQRPGAFLGLALGAGLLAGRLTRGVKDASSDTSAGDGPSRGNHSAPSIATSGPESYSATVPAPPTASPLGEIGRNTAGVDNLTSEYPLLGQGI